MERRLRLIHSPTLVPIRDTIASAKRGRNEGGEQNSNGFDYGCDGWIGEGRGFATCGARLPGLRCGAFGGEARAARCLSEGEEAAARISRDGRVRRTLGARA